jgi:tetratricopeptide (TPR) repeat protein
MGEGEFALVKQHLETALHAEVSWVGDHDVCATLVDVAAMQRDEAAIRQYAPQAEDLAVRYGHVLYQAIAHRAWGVAHRLAGEHAEAETRLNQALELFRGLETQWQIGRTLFELGELAVARTNAADAHVFFTRALALFEDLRAAPDAARTRTALGLLSRPGGIPAQGRRT